MSEVVDDRGNIAVLRSVWNLLDEAISSVEGGVHSGAWEMVGEAMDRVRLALPPGEIGTSPTVRQREMEDDNYPAPEPSSSA